jgi:hypothetical protein
MRRLTDEEWETTTGPFSYIRSTFPYWKTKHRALASQWLEAHCSPGWFYEADGVAVFELSDDALAFRVWSTQDPFDLCRQRLAPRPLSSALEMMGLD